MQLFTLPLAISVSINGGFVPGGVFVPGLCRMVEYPFPLPMAAFLATGALTLLKTRAV